MEDNDSGGDSIMDSGQASVESQDNIYDLKNIREARGITLHDIFHTSRVSIINLEAIEKGEFERLPTPFISKSFIRIYAKAIGVDPEIIIRQYDDYLKTKGLKRLGEDAVVLNQQGTKPIPYKKIGIALLAVIGLGIIIFAGYYFYPHISQLIASTIEQKQTEPNTADNVPEVSTPAKPTVAASPVNIPYPFQKG